MAVQGKGGLEWERCPASDKLVSMGYWCLIVQKIGSPFGPAFNFDHLVDPSPVEVRLGYFHDAAIPGSKAGVLRRKWRPKSKDFPQETHNREKESLGKTANLKASQVCASVSATDDVIVANLFTP